MPEPVPTAAELVHMGPEYATAGGWVRKSKNAKAEPTAIRIHEAGHRLMGEVMARNAAEAVAAGEGDWYPDPPHRRPRGDHA